MLDILGAQYTHDVNPLNYTRDKPICNQILIFMADSQNNNLHEEGY